MIISSHKLVASLPAELEANAIYYVRVAQGFDTYVTNGTGLVIAYSDNAKLLAEQAMLGFSEVVNVTASRALTLADAGKYLVCTSASDIVLTMPAQATVAWPVNCEIHLERSGVGGVSVAQAGSAVVNSSETLILAKQYSAGTLKRRAVDAWTLVGQLQAAV